MVAVAVVMGDATRVYYDDPLAIVTRSGSGIRRLHQVTALEDAEVLSCKGLVDGRGHRI